MSRILVTPKADSLLLNGCVIGGPPTKRNGASSPVSSLPAFFFATIQVFLPMIHLLGSLGL